MIVAFQDNRGNGAALRQALLDAGHQVEDALPLLRAGKAGDVLLTDYDDGPPYEALCDAHAKVLVHPHGAGLVGWTEPHAHTIGQFVHGPGQKEVLRRAGYRPRVEVIGWNFCEQRPFRGAPTEHPRVLFGLQHAMADGWIEPWMAKLHGPIFDALIALPIHLTVTAVGSTRQLMDLHLSQHPVTGGSLSCHTVDGTAAMAVANVDAADVVIGPAYSLPCIAIARGVPTIMFGQTPQPVEGYGVPLHPPASWEKYNEYATYPLLVERWARADIPDWITRMLKIACDEELYLYMNRSWHGRFIGPAFDPGAFVATFERAVKEWA